MMGGVYDMHEDERNKCIGVLSVHSGQKCWWKLGRPDAEQIQAMPLSMEGDGGMMRCRSAWKHRFMLWQRLDLGCYIYAVAKARTPLHDHAEAVIEAQPEVLSAVQVMVVEPVGAARGS